MKLTHRQHQRGSHLSLAEKSNWKEGIQNLIRPRRQCTIFFFKIKTKQIVYWRATFTEMYVLKNRGSFKFLESWGGVKPKFLIIFVTIILPSSVILWHNPCSMYSITKIWPPEADFSSSFCTCKSQKRKKDSVDLTVFLCFWDLGAKAASKTLVKLTPDGMTNVTNSC